MIDYITRHAIKNVWCTPDQDYQHIFKPARISRLRGERQYVKVEWDTISLPNNVDTFQVYQIGQLSPLFINLIPDEGKWYLASTACNTNNMVIDLYLNNGRQFPRFQTWIRKTRTRNLIIAVKEQPRIGNLREEDLYIRFYSNAFFGSARSQESIDSIHTEGIVVTTTTSVVNFQNKRIQIEATGGHTYLFHNGWLVNDTRPDVVVEGDVLELVRDTSIYDVVDYPVTDLDTFTSIRDNIKKYLISRPKGSTDTIEYHDDVDFWLLNPNVNSFKGVFFHKNRSLAARMVTHKDYSIPVNHVIAFSNEFDDWLDPTGLTVRLHIRKSGYQRSLIDEHQRIKELYKLNDEQIYRAMTGAESSLPIWRAEALENSAYVKLMGSKIGDITKEMVQDAYGYNAISKILADTPSVVKNISGYMGVELPVGLRNRSHMFEYDSQGKLINFYFHSAGETYITKNDNATLVEGIVGSGGDVLDTTYGMRRSPYNPNRNYRYYICRKIGGIPTYNWEDVTGSDKYVIIDNEIVWFVDEETEYTAVRSDDKFLAYKLSLSPTNGLIRFSIIAREVEFNNLRAEPVKIPLGKLELFLNGRALIENLDYYVKWPEVVIVNKEYLKTSDPQEIVVRAAGFCKNDLTREAPAEVGFVEHGLLSRNRKFDIRDDKVMRFIVDGKTWHRSALKFSEDHFGVMMDNVRNGAPYCIEDVIVPLRGASIDDTYSLRAKSQEVDKMVSDYLTLKHPELPIIEPSLIPERYQIVSPFISRIHYDLLNGYLNPPGIEGHYNEMDIRSWVNSYEWLLGFDPVVNGHDERYVNVHPHHLFTVTTLDVYKYTFLHRVIKLYLNDKVDLSHFVQIG